MASGFEVFVATEEVEIPDYVVDMRSFMGAGPVKNATESTPLDSFARVYKGEVSFGGGID